MSKMSSDNAILSLQCDMEESIKEHLHKPIISVSPTDGAVTGNTYQSIMLGSEIIPGFRGEEREVFGGVDLTGRSVIDLGCNLGEICRDAARLGAIKVEGVDCDGFFIQMARYISAFNGIDGIRYRQENLMTPCAYVGSYDITLALSSFTFVSKHLRQISEMTNDMLIVETHSVSESWPRHYLDALREHFRYVAVVGVVPDRRSSRENSRFILFASRAPLDGILVQRARDTKVNPDTLRVDLSLSSIPYYDAAFSALGLESGMSIEQLMAVVTRKHWFNITPDAVSDEVAMRGVVQSPNYWGAFLKGYSEYKSNGKLSPDNIYFRTMRELNRRGLYDRAFASLESDQDGAAKRFGKRFHDLDKLLENREGWDMAPVIVYNPLLSNWRSRGESLYLHVVQGGMTVYPIALDGYHRIFSAYLSGHKSVPFIPFWYEDMREVQRIIDGGVYNIKELIWGQVLEFAQRKIPMDESTQN